jgi:hypothetical protein
VVFDMEPIGFLILGVAGALIVGVIWLLGQW